MTEEKLPDDKADAKAMSAATKKITLTVDVPAENDVVSCEVCGHQNPKTAAMCAMCSNYLK